MERWLEVLDFPGYSVSNQGRVRNDYTGRLLVIFRNQHGVSHVSMNKAGRQYKRGIAKLVAERFLPHTTLDELPTPIHLDGDRSNNDVSNLAWRPKWFADQYTKQWNYHGTRINGPIIDVTTGTRYSNSTEAAKQHGLLERDILESIEDDRKVYPTLQKFALAGR